MPSGVLALSRSNRWLIVSNELDLQAISEWQVKVISEERSTALYEHVSHFWTQGRPAPDSKKLPRLTVRRKPLPRVSSVPSLPLPPSVFSALSEELPFIYTSFFDEQDTQAIKEIAQRHSFSSHYTLFVAFFVFVYLEALCQRHQLYAISDMQNMMDSEFPRHPVNFVASALDGICGVWAQHRMRSMSPKHPCGLPVHLVLRSRTHLHERTVLIPYAHEASENPLGLPPLKEKHLIKLGKVRELFRGSTPKLFFDPLSWASAMFPRLGHGRGVSLQPYNLSVRGSREETANIVAALGASFFQDRPTQKNLRKYLTPEQVEYCDEAFKQNDSALHVICRDFGREALFVGIEYGDMGPRASLYAVQKNGAVACLASIWRLGQSTEAPPLKSSFSSRHIGIDVVQRIAEAAARCAQNSPSGMAEIDEKEEKPLLLVAQSHPRAPYVAGCGIRALSVTKNRQLYVIRTCGTTAQWDFHDCFHAVRHGRESGPQLRRAVVEESGDYIPLPMIPGLDANRLDFLTVAEMLQYYYLEMVRQRLDKIYLHDADHIVARHVLRSHQHYYRTKRGCGIAAVFVAQHSSPECRCGSFFAQRVCGSVIEFGIARCYDKHQKLRRPLVLVDSSEARKRPREFDDF